MRSNVRVLGTTLTFSEGTESTVNDWASERVYSLNPTARSTLDAGGDVDAVLSGSLYRRIAMLDVGQILEVISRDSRNHEDICNWCERTGHTIQGVVEEKNETIFWIRKTG